MRGSRIRKSSILFPLRSFSYSHHQIKEGEQSVLILLDQCHSSASLSTLSKLHSQLHPISNPSVTIKLMTAYSACGRPSLTRHLFDQTPEHDKNIVFFNVMIRSYVNNDLHRDAILLFSRLCHSHTARPDHYTYPCALKACSSTGNLSGGIQVHAAVTKIGLDSNIFVGNSLITMYSRCNLAALALRVFQGMPNRDVVSWNSIVSGFSHCGQFDEAVGLCREMVERQKPSPDAGTMASILPAMSKTDLSNVELVRRMFDEMGKRKGLVSWNAMIAIYASNSMAKEAVDVFLTMEKEGVEPDAVTLASVLPACGVLSSLGLGKMIHDYVDKKMMFPNLVLENALMDMYANCGCLTIAKQIFGGMKEKDLFSWTAIISAYGMHGCGQEAVAFFEKMQETGIVPDHVAFLAVLSACSCSGLLEEGKHYFRCMTDSYRLVPKIEHFSCMVDLLGRAGCVVEAYDFIVKMPIDPNERVWGALLAACRTHSNISVGLVAADHLFRLVPKQAGYYVLLSNIYARAGRWEDVMSVRSIMVRKGIKKVAGCSSVELEGRVHNFRVGDRSHPQSKEIYAELDVLMIKLKDAGYVADTECALHDVEEEDKEGHLSVHSEKLAIAFMMVNSGPEKLIRITMNLRICGDCHRAAKLISSIMGRDIVLRDTNRFHHFERGVCSCGDYW